MTPTLVLVLLATGLAMHACITTYVLSIAAVSRLCGIPVLEATVGVGPTLFTLRRFGFPLAIRLIPLSGFARPLGLADEDSEEEAAEAAASGADDFPGARRFREAPLPARLAIVLAGPLASLALGAALLAAPIAAATRHLAVHATPPPGAVPVQPSGVPGLCVVDGAPTAGTELALVRDTAARFVHRLITLAPMDGCGFALGYVFTTVAVARLSVWSWLACLGVLWFAVGAFNLLPLPGLLGFSVVTEPLYSLFSPIEVEAIQRRVNLLFLAGFVTMVGFMLRALVVDWRWLRSTPLFPG